LLGKNLACLPVGAGFGLVLLLLVCLRLKASPLVFVASVFQLAALLALAAMAGNIVSILAPYRIQPGTMKPTKMPALAMLTLMASHCCFPIAMAPAFVPALAQLACQREGWPGAPINLVLSALLALAVALAYWQSLGPLGRLLARRETRILDVVSMEVE
jgi:hypothetical protein